jgi:hypothetical protein
MRYLQLKTLKHHYQTHYNNANGNGYDNSVDPNPTKDPNQYLAPMAGRIDLVGVIMILAAALSIFASIIAIKKGIQ